MEPVAIIEDYPLKSLTTLQVGGPARYFIELTDQTELPALVDFAVSKQVPLQVIGGGSNILIPDEGFTGLAVRNQLSGMEIYEEADRVILQVAAGENFDELVALSVGQGWWGLENLSHIPGSVGAAPIQNIGAYGVEVSDCIKSVEVYDLKTHTFLCLENDQCNFGYRNSIFKTQVGASYVVTSVTFVLSKQPQPHLAYKDLLPLKDVSASQQTIRDTIIAIRARKFPDWHTVGTAGSFFKNPLVSNEEADVLLHKFPDIPTYETESGIKISLGFILDKICGLKGYRDGNVGLYHEQALVLVNHGGATAEEIISFINTIADQVYKKTNLHIEWEVQMM